MKRKKAVTPSSVSIEKIVSEAPGTKQTTIDSMWICLFSGLLFASMTVQTGRMSLILLVLALALSVGRAPLGHLRQRFCVPALGFIAFAFMQGFAAIYSHFGEYAIREYQKFLAAFALAVILLVRIEKKHVRGILWGVAGICAVISLVCVDAASFGVLFDGFNSVIELMGATFSDIEQDVFGTRVSGIYNDANVSASILALGSLVSLYLTDSEKVIWKKALACVLLGISAMGFFLSMSRGAILCFALALLVWLIAAGKGNRLSLFFLMFFSAVVVAGLSIPAMTAINGGSFLPDVLLPVSGLVIFALDWAVGSRLARLLEGRGKAIAVVAVVLAVLCVGYGVAAMAVTGPYAFRQDWEGIDRVVKLEPGNYTVSGDWDGAPFVRVFSQSEMDLLQRTGGGTVLYEGPLADTDFTVTGDEYRLFLRIYGEAGNSIREVIISDGTKVALSHPLLPSFLASRLQDDLLTSNSFLQRLQFFKDGWKLFGRAPLLGSGLGSTEGLLTSVQSYYYESKYVHNHVLQVMDDMGLVGLAAFLALLGGALWLLLRRLREERDGLAALLMACWVMINTHSLMEINFSVRAYQCLAFSLLLLPAVLYAKPLSERFAKAGGIVTACLLWLYLAVFGGLYLSHRMVVRDMQKGFSTSDVDEFMEYCESLVSRDVFDRENNRLTYVANAVQLNSSKYNRELRMYTEALRKSGTYPACSGLARYYYLPKGQLEELFACSREGIAQEASAKEAWNLQFDFYRNEVLPSINAAQAEAFLDGVLETKTYLEEYSQGRLEEIQLTEENQSFLSAVETVRATAQSDEAAYQLLWMMCPPADEGGEG